MQRFYFHLSDHTKIEDCRGDACHSIEEARAFAREMAADLGRARHGKDRGLYICVTDANGKEVFRTAVVKGWREAKVEDFVAAER